MKTAVIAASDVLVRDYKLVLIFYGETDAALL